MDRAFDDMSAFLMTRTLLAAACVLLGLGAVALAQDPAAIDAGEQLYDEHCASCHGEKLRSTGAMPDLRELRADAWRASIKWS